MPYVPDVSPSPESSMCRFIALLFTTLLYLCIAPDALHARPLLPDEATCLADADACYEVISSLAHQAPNADRYALARKLCAASDPEAGVARCEEEYKKDPDYQPNVYTAARQNCHRAARKHCTLETQLATKLDKLEALERACHDGDSKACLDAALFLSPIFVTDHGFEIAALHARDLFYRGTPVSRSGGRITGINPDGERTFPSIARAATFAQRSCDLGLEAGCTLRGEYYPEEIVEDYSPETLSTHETACRRGEEGACRVMLHTAWFAHLDLHSFSSHKLEPAALEQRQALDKRLGEAMASACKRGDTWSCELIARVALVRPQGALFALPDDLDTFARKMCRSSGSKMLCMITQSACVADPKSCTPSQKTELFAALDEPCQQGQFEACYASLYVCARGSFDPHSGCPPTLPELDTITSVYADHPPFMWEELLLLTEHRRGYFHKEPTPLEVSWRRWYGRLHEVIFSNHIARCEREGVCLFGRFAYKVDPALRGVDRQGAPIYTRYREVIRQQCTEHDRACDVWVNRYEKTREEWLELRDQVSARCLRGDAQACQMYLDRLTSQHEPPTQIEARLCALQGLSPCPWTQARQTLTRCEQDPGACDEILRRREFRLTLSRERLEEIALAMCRGGDHGQCKSLLDSSWSLDTQAAAHAHLCLFAEDEPPAPGRRRPTLDHCQRAMITASGAKRVREFTHACHNQDDLLACQALEYIHEEGYQTVITEHDRIKHLDAAKKGCELGSDEACSSLYFGQVNKLVKIDHFRSFGQMEEHEELATRFLTYEVTVELARTSCERGEHTSCSPLLDTLPARARLKSMWRGCTAQLESEERSFMVCEMALEQDEKATFAHYREVCSSAGTLQACMTYENLLHSARSLESLGDPEAFVQGCNAGVMPDCFALSAMRGRSLLTLLTQETRDHLAALCGDSRPSHSLCGRLPTPDRDREDEETQRERCRQGGVCMPGVTELLTPYHIDWEEDLVLFDHACEQGSMHACLLAILYHERGFLPRHNRYLNPRSPDPPDIVHRDTLIQNACAPDQEHVVCVALRGLQMHHSKDPEVRAHAWHNFLDACLKIDPRGLYDFMTIDKVYDVSHACKMADMLTPMHELDASTQTRVAARFLIHDSAPIGSWLHPEVKFVLEKQPVLEALFEELRGEKKQNTDNRARGFIR